MKVRTRAGILFGALLLQSIISFFPQAQAQSLAFDPGFDPNRILEDADIFDVNGMSFERLVSFLREKGTLADTKIPDIDGVVKPVPNIIWRVATSYKINPKYLLALLQKEQSLVDDPHPSQKQFDWATGYGVCDDCSKDDPAIQLFKGFASQVEWAAKQHREKYLIQILGNGTTKAGKAAGKAMTVDGVTVTPTNNATAMLYSYTPHLHGNFNLWRIWQRWFSLVYPDGTVVRGKSSKKTYLIHLGQKRPFASRAVTETLVDTSKIIEVSETELAAYPLGPMIRFPKYALLRDPKKHIWLLTKENRRRIADAKTFKKFGFNEDEIEEVTDADLADYPIGPTININTQFPQGTILQNQVTKNYWYVEDGERHLIPSPIFLKLYFVGRSIKKVTPAALTKYSLGEPYALHDGELVRSAHHAGVHVVENGALRPVPSAQIFEALGWKWDNIVTLPDEVLKNYPTGDPVTLQTFTPPSL